MQNDDGCKVVIEYPSHAGVVFLTLRRMCPQLGQVRHVGEATDDAQSMPFGRPMHEHKHGRNVK